MSTGTPRWLVCIVGMLAVTWGIQALAWSWHHWWPGSRAIRRGRNLLGRDLQRLLPLLGSPEAEGACIRLRRYHLRAGRRSLKHLALLLACALYIAAGAITLGTMEGYWNSHIDQSVRLGSR